MAPRDRQHILIRQRAQAEPFSPPPRIIPGKEHPVPQDRRTHGGRIAGALREAAERGRSNRAESQIGLPQRAEGIYVAFESFPGLDLALEKLDPSQGKLHPELLSVQRIGPDGEEVEKATVYIPDGKLGYFLKRLQQYVETAGQEKPRHLDLVDRIQSVGLASLRELWTDEPADFPVGDDPVWWEVWLRRQGGRELETIVEFANAIGARLGHQSLGFSNRTVVLVEATPGQLTQALDVLDDFAELRKPRQAAQLLAEEPAGALASRGAVAIFPVAGWWKHNRKQDNDRRRARYSLILSIETPEEDVDIWTPVAQQVGIPAEVVT